MTNGFYTGHNPTISLEALFHYDVCTPFEQQITQTASETPEQSTQITDILKEWPSRIAVVWLVSQLCLAVGELRVWEKLSI